ncbi:MAG: CHC2 zinc finger domain-containing protein, partial [Methylococcales bacterium]
MPGRIPQTFIDDLMARVDIVDLIDSKVPLKRSGRNHVARCPFHQEKTPSFTVNREKQMYHCFGCSASGTAIGFLMDYDHLNFVEAVEDLARYVGLEVPRGDMDGPSSTDALKLDVLY